MGYAQHTEIDRSTDAAEREASQRAVPHDWFVDPADRDSRAASLEEAATAFLAAHEAGLLTDAAPRLLTEGFADQPEFAASQPSAAVDTELTATLWDAVAPFADDEGGVLAWQAEALCAQTDPEAFFPEKGGSTRDAKRVCAGCAVRQDCLDYALENDERFGIWGGLSERERKRLRREGR